MIFGKDTAIYGLGAGLAALALYLVATSSNDAKQELAVAKFDTQVAKFDRDFAARTGNREAELEAKDDLKVAKERLAKAQLVADRKQAEKTAQEEAMLHGVRSDLKEKSDGTMDLDAALKELK